MSTSYQVSSPRHDAPPITLRACRRTEGVAEPAIDVCLRYPHEQARSSFVIGRSGEITVMCRVKQVRWKPLLVLQWPPNSSSLERLVEPAVSATSRLASRLRNMSIGDQSSFESVESRLREHRLVAEAANFVHQRLTALEVQTKLASSLKDPHAALSAAAAQLITRTRGEPLRQLAAAHGRLSRGVATLTSRIVSHALAGLDRDVSREQFAALLPPFVYAEGQILAVPGFAPQRAAAAASAALNSLATAAADPASLRLGFTSDPLASAAAAASASEFPAAFGGLAAQRSRIAATVGSFGLPVTGGWLSSRYGWREARKKFHKGIDIAVEENTPVVAAQAGRISFAGWRKGYGYVVVVDHGKGYASLYAHCNRFVARKGQAVGKGQAIALSGNTGHSTGPHLHFEIHRHGSPVDPLLLLPSDVKGEAR
ncbi:hypothetical protein CLOM_g10227 [Closterium sp. NIES-68]|nr:hypothetical protein CLOM_g10227 [Closterium sp. NIES-68]GJP57609.1 hypothetical protein CLOP_g22127 [Closterium sp. NIES-67]